MDISKYIDGHIGLIKTIADEHSQTIFQIADTIVSTFQSGGKLLLMGNGGSAADAQHFAGELVGRFQKDRKAIAAIALTTDAVTMTAVGNDYGFDSIFSRQVEALATPVDVIFGISTSGRSENVVKALQKGKDLGCTTLCLSGGNGGPLAQTADKALVVPSFEVPHIQEAHIMIIHILCSMIESRLAVQAKSLT